MFKAISTKQNFMQTNTADYDGQRIHKMEENMEGDRANWNKETCVYDREVSTKS